MDSSSARRVGPWEQQYQNEDANILRIFMFQSAFPGLPDVTKANRMYILMDIRLSKRDISKACTFSKIGTMNKSPPITSSMAVAVAKTAPS